VGLGTDDTGPAAPSPKQVEETMPKVVMYSTALCPFCVMAERLLQKKGIAEIEKRRVDLDGNLLSEMMALTKRRTVPQIFIDDRHVGGFDDLSMLDRSGQLDQLLCRN
jgi:glutaredoxin 3